jgi:hypothetical protein
VKIEQVIVLHLLSHKEVTLQGIGVFRLDPSVSLPAETERDFVIPENAVSFEYDPRATEDPALIDSIVQHTTKIKPLASSDLDSFLTLGKQFMNIGKPFTLDRLGTLDKAQSGELFFIPGEFITPKIEAPKALKEDENEENTGLFHTYNRQSDNSGKKILSIVATLIILGIIGWAIYYFMFSKTSREVEPINQQPNSVTDSSTVAGSSSPNDSALVKDSSLVKNSPQLEKDSTQEAANPENDLTFKVVFKQSRNKDEAIKTMNRLNGWGHHVTMYTDDSIIYKLAEVFKRPLTDTTRVKDSMERFYGNRVFVQTK